MINGVVGVTFWTDDLEKMFRFYNDVLQLPLHSRHPDFIAFDLGRGGPDGNASMRFNIGLHDRVSGASKDSYRFMPTWAWTTFTPSPRGWPMPEWSSYGSRSRRAGAAGSPPSATRTATPCNSCNWRKD